MKYITFALLMLPFVVNAQDELAKSKFIFGFTFSPDYSFRRLVYDDNTKFLGDFYEEREIPRFGFTAGMNVKYELNERLCLEGGIMVSQKGWASKEFGNMEGVISIGTHGEVKSTKYSYAHYYFDVPLKINIYLNSGKNRFYLTSGILPGFYIGSRFNYYLNYVNGIKTENHAKEKYDFTPVNFGLLGGFGFEASISEKIVLKFEPLVRFSLNSLNNGPIKHYLYSAGINCGAYFNIK